MEINGLKFRRNFDSNGVSSGFDVDKRFTWSGEYNRKALFADYHKEVKITGLTLPELKLLADSINKFVKVQKKGEKNDQNLRADINQYIIDNAYNSTDIAYRKGFNSVLETCRFGLEMTEMSVNEIIAKIREFKQRFTDYDGYHVVEYEPLFGTSREVDCDVIKLDGYNKAMHALLRIIESHKEEAEDKDAVGNWKPKTKVIKLGQKK